MSHTARLGSVPVWTKATMAAFAAAIAAAVVFHFPSSRFHLGGKAPIYRRYSVMDFQREVRFYEDRVKAQPDSFMDLAYLGSLYSGQARHTGDPSLYDTAETWANLSLKAFPKPNPNAWLVLAQVAQARHQFDRAIKIANEVLPSTSTPGAALGVLVTAYLATGDLARASESADLLIQVRPGLSQLAMRALVEAAQGREAEATFDFESAFRFQDVGDEQEAAWVRSVYARFLMKRRQFSAADEQLRIALLHYPAFHLALSIRGDLHRTQGEWEQAAKDYDEAFSSSKQPIYLIRLGEAKQQLGDADGADTYFHLAENSARQEISRGAYGHRLDLARLLLIRGHGGDAAEALVLARADVKMRPAADPYLVLAQAELRAGLFPDALKSILAVLRTGVRDPEAYLLASEIEFALKNTRRAKFYSGCATRKESACQASDFD